MLRMDDPAIQGDLKRVYATHEAQHATPHGKLAFKKAFHSIHKAGHGVHAATRIGHLAAHRAEGTLRKRAKVKHSAAHPGFKALVKQGVPPGALANAARNASAKAVAANPRLKRVAGFKKKGA